MSSQCSQQGIEETTLPPLVDQSISVVVPAHDPGEQLIRCLSSLAATSPAPKEIIVVVDGGSEDACRVAREYGARVLATLVRSGPAKARNLGARAAQGEILFFVDSDVEVSPGVFAATGAEFERRPGLAALFGSYDDAPAAANFLSQYKNLLHHHVHQTGREEASTFWAGCGAIRRDLFLSINGFDERYREPSIEDIELGYRLRQAGHEIRLCRWLQVKHLKRWDAVSLLKSDFFQRALPWTELILRDRAFVDDLNLKLSERVSLLSVYGVAATLALAPRWVALLPVTVVLILLLVALHAPLYRLFLRRHGPWFAARAVLWHWLYYLYSGVAFAVGVVRFLRGGRRKSEWDRQICSSR